MHLQPPERIAIRHRPLSQSRGFITDLVSLAQSFPLFPVDIDIQLSEVAKCRLEVPQRIGWSAIFLKAYGHVASRVPELRSWFSRGIRSRLVTASQSVASLAVNRKEQDGDHLFFAKIPSPNLLSLLDIQRYINYCNQSPVEDVFRRQLQLENLPGPLRRLILWQNINSRSPKRCTRVGTFSLSTLAGMGASNHGHPTICTTSLSFTPLNPDGLCRVTLISDHRVLDGVTAAKALILLKETLNTSIIGELKNLKNPLERLQNDAHEDAA